MAIAVSPTNGGAGWAYNYGTRSAAQPAARTNCARKSGAGCRLIAWSRNACSAVAYRELNGRLVEYAGSWAYTRAAAI